MRRSSYNNEPKGPSSARRRAPARASASPARGAPARAAASPSPARPKRTTPKAAAAEEPVADVVSVAVSINLSQLRKEFVVNAIFKAAVPCLLLLLSRRGLPADGLTHSLAVAGIVQLIIMFLAVPAGAILNCALSTGLASAGKLGWLDAAAQVVVQCAGAAFGMQLVGLLVPDALAGGGAPPPLADAAAAYEFALTFANVSVGLLAAHYHPEYKVPLIGSLVGVLVVCGGMMDPGGVFGAYYIYSASLPITRRLPPSSSPPAPRRRRGRQALPPLNGHAKKAACCRAAPTSATRTPRPSTPPSPKTPRAAQKGGRRAARRREDAQDRLRRRRVARARHRDDASVILARIAWHQGPMSGLSCLSTRAASDRSATGTVHTQTRFHFGAVITACGSHIPW